MNSDILNDDDRSSGKDYRISEIETVNGEALTAHVPRYHIGNAHLKPVVDDHRVKIIGYGKRYKFNRGPGNERSFNFQAPEFVLEAQLGLSADIWSFGCTVLHLLLILYNKIY